jgi:hypothetical protein
MKRTAVAMLIAVALVLSSAPAFGYGDGMGMTMDVLIARPVALAATVLGTAVFIVALPFALTSGSVAATACGLVVTPFNYTFVRPVGDFSPKWESGNCRSWQPEPSEPDKAPAADKPSGS